jgi:putative NIF3 family GTP cyclohydrolase 1 type 2
VFNKSIAHFASTLPDMQIQTILEVLESIAPPQLQESYDNAGLIVGSPSDTVTGVLFCLDSTEAIIEEAVQKFGSVLTSIFAVS